MAPQAQETQKQKPTATDQQKDKAVTKKKAQSPSPPPRKSAAKSDKQTRAASPPAVSKPDTSKKLQSNTAVPVQVAQEPEVQLKKVIVNGKVPVDEKLPNSGNYQVIEKNNEVYSVTLNYTDTSNSNNNKFYIAQALVNQQTSQYFSFNRWGRIGVQGQQALKGPFSEFQAINEYTQQKNQKLKGGYLQIFIDWGCDIEPEEEKKTDKKGKSQSKGGDSEKLQKEVEVLIGKIFDGKMMENSIKEIGYDPKKMPLGKLAERTINEAYKALDQLQKAIQNQDTAKMKEQANKFFTLIPHDIGFKKTNQVLILNTQQHVLKKLDMLKDLSDMKIAAQMVGDSGSGDSQTLSNYQKLQNEIQTLPRNSEDFQVIEELIKKTQGSYQLTIQNVYTLDREGETARFAKNIGNDHLLWHGSRMSNFVGILSQGLRIAPPEAPASGYNYGKGVYFADLLEKSTDYTRYDTSNGDILLLLCQVAVGKPNVLEKTDFNASNLPPKCNSTFGWGTRAPDEKENQFIDGGKTRVPVGQIITTQSKHYMGANEYIIYNEAQSRMRFLVNLQVENHGY